MSEDNVTPKHIPVLHPVRPTLGARVWSRLQRLRYRLLRRHEKVGPADEPSIDWKARARALGVYAVIDGRHAPQEYDYVTLKQKEILLPILREAIQNPKAGDALDYGCGVGRFTEDLAQFVSGVAVGYDPTSELIALAPKAAGTVSFTDRVEDVLDGQRRYGLIWVCLVLGGLSDQQLRETAIQLSGALLPGGIILVMEATAQVPRGQHWKVRTPEQVMDVFAAVSLKKIDEYRDVDQDISIFLGKSE
jgi:SAM-dependent methyltransferase